MAGKIGKAIGFPGLKDDFSDEPEMDEEAPASEDTEPKAATAETLAMKQFERATTTEAKVQAMKDFLEACGATGASY